MRRELLNTKNNFYKKYPGTCIFLIEEVYSDIEGKDFVFNTNKNIISIHYINKNDEVIREETPKKEVENWLIGNYNANKRFYFHDSESYLRKIYKLCNTK